MSSPGVRYYQKSVRQRWMITMSMRLEKFLDSCASQEFGTILVDPPWQFMNKTGKVAPEHRRLHRYRTMGFDEIQSLAVQSVAADKSHLYLWVPNALLMEGLEVMKAWGFTYKTNLVWYKVRKDGGPDGRGVGFYYRNVTELVLFGVRGGLRTGPAGRRQVNILLSRKREHSRKPDELYEIIQQCSPGPYLELFARHHHPGWYQWGDQYFYWPMLRADRHPDDYQLLDIPTEKLEVD